MIANGTQHLNGNGTPIYLECSSDYEERPIFDVVPKPKPGWRDQHALFTHHVQWLDGDNVQHGLTLRSDSLQDLLSDLRLVKRMIKAAKSKKNSAVPVSPTELASQAEPEQPDVPRKAKQNNAISVSPTDTVEPEQQPDVQRCRIHGVSMARRVSKRTGGSYFSHMLPDHSLCYGRPRKA